MTDTLNPYLDDVYTMSYACPVKFFAEKEQSEFNWGANSYELQ